MNQQYQPGLTAWLYSIPVLPEPLITNSFAFPKMVRPSKNHLHSLALIQSGLVLQLPLLLGLD
jgi:hypothetical protein